MKNTIDTPYLNIDIVIESDFKIDDFIEFMKKKSEVLSYNFPKSPSDTIKLIINIINSLPENLKEIFYNIRKKVLDIGYECDNINYVLDSFISNDVLRKVSELGFSINIRLYPNIQDKADIVTI